MKKHQTYKNLFILDHPLIQHKLFHLRDVNTSTNNFRRLMREIANLMGYEVTRDLPTEMRMVETPLEKAQVPTLAGKKVAIVPILRAGLGMADGLRDLLPSAREGHIGIYRNEETKQPVEYMINLPTTKNRLFLLVDPMLATGGTAVHAIQVLKDRGVEPHMIRFLSLVAAPEGVEAVSKAHPQVAIYTASLDRDLNEHAYILPGLGDAGDRLFGTK